MEQHILELINAGDVVLLPDREQRLQQITDICAEEGTKLGFEFRSAKWEVLDFNNEARNKSVFV